MLAVNLDLMLQAMIDSAKGKPNQIVFWSRQESDAHAQSRRDLRDAVFQHRGCRSDGAVNPAGG